MDEALGKYCGQLIYFENNTGSFLSKYLKAAPLLTTIPMGLKIIEIRFFNISNKSTVLQQFPIDLSSLEYSY